MLRKYDYYVEKIPFKNPLFIQTHNYFKPISTQIRRVFCQLNRYCFPTHAAPQCNTSARYYEEASARRQANMYSRAVFFITHQPHFQHSLPLTCRARIAEGHQIRQSGLTIPGDRERIEAFRYFPTFSRE